MVEIIHSMETPELVVVVIEMVPQHMNREAVVLLWLMPEYVRHKIYKITAMIIFIISAL